MDNHLLVIEKTQSNNELGSQINQITAQLKLKTEEFEKIQQRISISNIYCGNPEGCQQSNYKMTI